MVSRVSAVLGPTNTGKTHLAMERLLAHRSGMIGFPLRLLARENYDRAVRVKGAAQVALITGEEKILPPQARYFICTAESMPIDRPVDFLAVDEIQLCGDADRGHIFTDRLLHARGLEETLFLGADTMGPLIRRLVPGCTFDTRDRFSRLTYTGTARLTRLPPRSALVAFSAEDVYAMAEMLRRQKGGAAIVMGALSPRTRNAQVALYQSGDVDYLVATDAIGMGLNMDIDHVAFAALEKFDGMDMRRLTAAEIAQIAGRAGRYRKDGTFGVTTGARDMPEEIIDRVESHVFPAQRHLFWRNTALDFRSIDRLVASLNQSSPTDGLIRVRTADDQTALDALALDGDISRSATSFETVSLLWDVCRIPDFRKLSAETHVRLLTQVYKHLQGPTGCLPDDFVSTQIRRVDRTDGDIHTLVDRIAAIRVWTYISHRGGWLADPPHWQGVTRALEDRLSDALHDRLTQRFVDRRTALLLRRLKERTMHDVEVLASDGRVLVEGHPIGRLDGLEFIPETTGERGQDRVVPGMAFQVLVPEVRARLGQLLGDEDSVFHLDPLGPILWRGSVVARLDKGSHPLKPLVVLADNPLLEDPQKEALLTHLRGWITRQMEVRLAALLDLERAELTGSARGLAFQLLENLGTLPRGQGGESVDQLVRSLSEDERKSLARVHVRLGVGVLFVPGILKPSPQALLATLWRVFNGHPGGALPADGRVSFPSDPEVPAAFYLAIGYRATGTKAVRVDMLERFAADVRRLIRGETEKAAAEKTGAEKASTETIPPETSQAQPPQPDAGTPDAPVLPEGLPTQPTQEIEVESGADSGSESQDAVAVAPGEDPAPVPPVPVPQPGELRLPPDMLPQLGIDIEEGSRVLTALGYRARLDEGVLFLRPGRRVGGGPKRDRKPSGRPSQARSNQTADDQARPNQARRDRPEKTPSDARAGHRGRSPDERTKGRDQKRERDRDRASVRPASPPVPRDRPRKEADPDSPFAVLGALLKR